MGINYNNLSRTISQALRHDPGSYGLTLDSEGWVSVEDLLDALVATDAAWQELTVNDIHEMIRRSEKKRHEIDGHRIRAMYGHSLLAMVERQPAQPPDLLFHGTSPEAALRISAEGLLPMGRQYVHLSKDEDTARRVGSRKTSTPIILCVDAIIAFQQGVRFYQGNDSIWLADHVLAKFIRSPDAD